MSERVLTALNTWEGLDDDYSRVEIVENTNIHGQAQTRAYAYRFDEQSGKMRRLQVKNIYRGDSESLSSAEDSYLSEIDENGADAYQQHKNSLKPVGLWHAGGSKGFDYQIVGVGEQVEHEGQEFIKIAVRTYEIVDGQEVARVDENYAPAEQVEIFPVKTTNPEAWQPATTEELKQETVQTYVKGFESGLRMASEVDQDILSTYFTLVKDVDEGKLERTELNDEVVLMLANAYVNGHRPSPQPQEEYSADFWPQEQTYRYRYPRTRKEKIKARVDDLVFDSKSAAKGLLTALNTKRIEAQIKATNKLSGVGTEDIDAKKEVSKKRKYTKKALGIVALAGFGYLAFKAGVNTEHNNHLGEYDYSHLINQNTNLTDTNVNLTQMLDHANTVSAHDAAQIASLKAQNHELTHQLAQHGIHASGGNGNEAIPPTTGGGSGGSSQNIAPSTFYVEKGSGFTNEISQYAHNKGVKLTGDQSYKIYLDLHKQFGDKIINIRNFNAPDTYSMGGPNLGLSSSGQARWYTPEVQAKLDQLIRSYGK